MEYWQAIVSLAALAIVGTLLLGWHDGWFRRAEAEPAAHPIHRVRRQSVVDNANYVGIAEVTRFAAMRRRIGYPAANRIMAALAARILADDRFEVGRLGRTGIEFFYRADHIAQAHAMMQDLKRRLEVTVTTTAIDFEPSIVIGCNSIRSGQLRDELFDAAACAVEDAQKLPERIRFAEDGRQRGGVDPSAMMLHNLYRAVRDDSLEMHYMPKLRLADSEIVSAEALCRWTHRDHGTVSPTIFIKLAEETGLIGDLTLWTLDRVIADQQRLRQEGIDLNIDINMSGQLIGDTGFCDLVIARIGASGGRIGIEITETAVIEDAQAALANLGRISQAGVRIAIDDFGVGLSSLAYLRDLPADELKIDQTFIRTLTTSNRDPLLVRSAIDIGHALEMEVTAEGVEDEIALALLKVMRVDHVQGYHISMPLPLDQLVRYLRGKAHLQILGDAAQLRASLSPLTIAATKR